MILITPVSLTMPAKSIDGQSIDNAPVIIRKLSVTEKDTVFKSSSKLLPGGMSTMISVLGVYYPDGTETQRKGIKIDISIKPTINGIKAGIDEPLEKVKALILNGGK